MLYCCSPILLASVSLGFLLPFCLLSHYIHLSSVCGVSGARPCVYQPRAASATASWARQAEENRGRFSPKQGAQCRRCKRGQSGWGPPAAVERGGRRGRECVTDWVSWQLAASDSDACGLPPHPSPTPTHRQTGRNRGTEGEGEGVDLES